jgi:hypothetical protein
MVPDADEKGRRRDRNSKRLAGPSREMVLRLLRAAPEFSFLEKWGCPTPEILSDLRARDVLSRMYKLWPRLTPDQRRLYLLTAEHIAEAEKAKISWNPKASRKRFMRLAKSAGAAAKLVRELSSILPPPWVGEEAKVGELVFGLASFIAGSVAATFPWDRDEAVHTASALLRTVKKKVVRKTGGMRWDLVRDLVWLASGKTITPDERTVRRYLDNQGSAKNPVEAYVRSHWDLFGNAYGLAKQWRPEPEIVDKLGPAESMPELGTPNLDSESFRRVAVNYLTSPR